MKAITVFCLLWSCTWSMATENTLPPGRSQTTLTFWSESADEYFDADQITRQLLSGRTEAEFERQSAWLTYDYGWKDAMTISFKAQYLQQDMDFTNGLDAIETNDFGDVYLGFKQRLSRAGSDQFIISEVGVWIPAGYDGSDPLPAGGDNISWDFLMGYGQYFYPVKGGFEMDFTFRKRNGTPDDEYFFNTLLYYKIGPAIKHVLNYHVIESKDDRLRLWDPLTYPAERGEQVLGTEFEITLSKRWYLNLKYKTTLEGRNAYESDAFGIGVLIEL